MVDKCKSNQRKAVLADAETFRTVLQACKARVPLTSSFVHRL